MYPPINELSVTVSVSDSSGLVSNITFPASQSNIFFDLGNNGSYTVTVDASHNTTGPSTPKIIPLISMCNKQCHVHVIVAKLSCYFLVA